MMSLMLFSGRLMVCSIMIVVIEFVDGILVVLIVMVVVVRLCGKKIFFMRMYNEYVVM